LDNPNDGEDDCAADIESDIEQHNGIEKPECSEQRDACAALNIPRLIWPIQKSHRQDEVVLVTVNAMETRRSNGSKNK